MIFLLTSEKKSYFKNEENRKIFHYPKSRFRARLFYVYSFYTFLLFFFTPLQFCFTCDIKFF